MAEISTVATFTTLFSHVVTVSAAHSSIGKIGKGGSLPPHLIELNTLATFSNLIEQHL